MKLLFLYVGKTTDDYVKSGIEVFYNRLRNYISFSELIVSHSKSTSKDLMIKEESESIFNRLLPGDYVVVLDENGKEITSREFSLRIEKWKVQGIQRVVFITGGAFGISDELKQKADLILSASRFTLTHQMIRLILVEQVYRAMTISRNEKYHHD